MFTNYIYYCTLCLRCLRHAPILRTFKTKRLNFSSLVSIDLKSKQQPSPREVAQLHQVFREPQNVIDDLTDLMTRIDPIHTPTFDLEQRLRGRLWRARLRFTWPVAFRVMGESTDRERAQHYAYLEACQMFQNLGLLSASGEIIDWKRELERMEEDVFSRLRLKSSLRFTSHLEEERQAGPWSSTLELTWPYPMVITGSGCTQQTAEMAAAALAFVKLKSLRYLNKYNAVVTTTQHVVHLGLKPSTSRAHQTSIPLTPDYEVWVDASKIGYGAYLVSNIDGTGNSARTRWLGEFWPNKIRDCYIVPKHFSSLTEFYALVCAIYTWKKKFEGHSVVVRSDSLHAVSLVNQGLTVDFNAPQGNMFLKLFRILQDTCSQYDITLSARHLNRYDNQAADSLSKLKMEKFFAMVPNATPNAKKSKKLLFFLPLVDMARPQPKSWEVK